MKDQNIIITWFNNLKINKINHEILCVFFNTKETGDYQNYISRFENSLKKILSENDINSNSYQIFTFKDYKDFLGKKLDSNIILICPIGMNILKISDYNSDLLCIKFDELKQNFESYSEYCYITKKEPLLILKYCSLDKKKYMLYNNFIYKEIFSKFEYFGDINYLKSDNVLASKSLSKELKYNLDVLCDKNILTCKLAIALYKSTTLRFNDSNTKIGTYFKKRLGISSKTMQLPNFEKEKIIIGMLKKKKIEISPNEAVNYYNKNKDKFTKEEINFISELPIYRAKAYDLNKSEIFSNE